MGAAELFDRIVRRTRREGMVERVAVVEPPPPDPEAGIRNDLQNWLSDDHGKQLMAWLTEQMNSAVERAHAHHANTFETTYDLGFEAGLRFVRDRLSKWAK